MTKLLRKVESYEKWVKQENRPKWLRKGELPAELLIDFNAKGNNISLYRVNSDEDLSNLIIALTHRIYVSRKQGNHGKTSISHFNFVLIGESVLKKAGFKPIESIGNTSFPEVNKLHIDISQLSDVQLSKLARLFYSTSSEAGFKGVPAIQKLIREKMTKESLSEPLINDLREIMKC